MIVNPPIVINTTIIINFYISAGLILFVDTCFSTSSPVGGAGTDAMFAAKCFAVVLLTPITLVEELSICRRYSAFAMISKRIKSSYYWARIR